MLPLLRRRGFALPAVLLILLVLGLMMPLFMIFSHYEATWGVKNTKVITAFQLADSAVERGYLQVTMSTTNWHAIQTGGTLAGYRFDQDYQDVSGGDYTIWIGSGTGNGTARIVGVGRDAMKREVRSIEAVYSSAQLGSTTVEANNGVSLTGNNYSVEWGAVVTPKNIVAGGATYPQLWSANNIDLDTNGASPPNCDTPGCCQWHSYTTNLPPAPQFDLNAYKLQAQAAGVGPCGSYYQSGSFTFSNCNDSSGNTYYIEGDATANSTGGGSHIVGNIIVMGALSFSNGNFASGSATVPIPQDAWKQYCNNWPHYQGFDGAAPGSFPGLNGTYLSSSSLSYTVAKVFVQGLLYVGKDVSTGNGGGGSAIVGVIYVGGAANFTSNSPVTIYYSSSAAAGILTTNVSLGRTSWQEVDYGYPFP